MNKRRKWDMGVEITYDPDTEEIKERLKDSRKKKPPFIKPTDAEKKRRPS